MVKHFSGGGPQKDGEDAHFPFGKEQVYPGDHFDYHLIPFTEGAFPAGVAQVMPYYGIPVGQTDEDVGFAFNKTIITDLLREKYQFEGVICSDWGLVSDATVFGLTLKAASAWGVEHLSPEQRMIKLLDAGIDQIGGETIPEMLVALVEKGTISEKRLDSSVRRLLLDKFRLGLFDNPYVDISQVKSTVGKPAFVEAGKNAQRKSLVLLKNASQFLPLTDTPKIYIENIDPEIAARFGKVVDKPTQADLAIIRIEAPYYPHDGLLEGFFHSGDLDFKGKEKARILSLLKTVPTVVDIYLDRAAVIPEIAENSAALIANFGATDEIVLEAIWGQFSPTGKLPFEMPSSMAAVKAQKEDVPYDSKAPLFPFDFGLSYGNK
jgi:beta-glucosidase